jgi:DNA-binding NarL/FixJ family response regulator
VSGQRRLHDGDAIRVGSTLLLFRDPAEHRSSIETATGGIEVTAELTPLQRRILIALCRPVADSGFAAPASNKAIADEVSLSVDAVKGHLRTLFAKLGVASLPQIQKRAALVERAFLLGLVTDEELRRGP